MSARLPLITVLAAFTVLSGCTHTRTLDPSPEASSLHEINERATRATATITLSTGERTRAEQLHLAPDVATWVTEDGGARSTPLGEIVAVEFESASRGSLDGLKIGVSIGAAAAALAAVTTPPCDPDPTLGEFLEGSLFCLGPGGAAAVAGIVVGGAASLVGLVVGRGKKSSTVYEVSEAEVATAEETAPTQIVPAPSGEARRILTEEEQRRMLQRLRALQEALAYEPGTGRLRQDVSAAQARAEEGYVLRDELPRLVDLFLQYRIN